MTNKRNKGNNAIKVKVASLPMCNSRNQLTREHCPFISKILSVVSLSNIFGIIGYKVVLINIILGFFDSKNPLFSGSVPEKA